MLGHALGKNLLRRARLVDRSLLGQEGLAQGTQARFRVTRIAGGQKVIGELLRLGLAGCKRPVGKALGQWPAEMTVRPDGRQNVVGRLAPVEAEGGEKRRVVLGRRADLRDEAAQIITAADDGAQQRLEARFTADVQNVGEGFGQFRLVAAGRARDHRAARLGDERRFHLVVEKLEMPGDVRFERKLVQDRFAEGVDGLDLQAAWRLKRLREEPPRANQPLARGRAPVEVADLRRERRIVQRGPRTQRLEDAVRHVRRRRSRIGEAQDARRVGAVQQQPDHTLRQDVRLARAGIGGHPGRILRVRCARLVADRRLGNDEIRFHSSPPPSSPPADHSRTRARWS